MTSDHEPVQNDQVGRWLRGGYGAAAVKGDGRADHDLVHSVIGRCCPVVDRHLRRAAADGAFTVLVPCLVDDARHFVYEVSYASAARPASCEVPELAMRADSAVPQVAGVQTFDDDAATPVEEVI